MRKLRSLLFRPKSFGPLLIIVFAVLLATLFRAEGVELDRLSVLAATIAAFSALILIYANQQAIEVSRALLEETVRQREMNTKPHVALWLEPHPPDNYGCDLVVKNIGRGPAYGVTLAFITGVHHFKKPRYRATRLIDNGIRFMAPGRELRELLAGMQYMPASPFRILVTYYPTKEQRPHELESEEFELNAWEAVSPIRDDAHAKALLEIAKELKAINPRSYKRGRYVTETGYEYQWRRLRESVRDWFSSF